MLTRRENFVVIAAGIISTALVAGLGILLVNLFPNADLEYWGPRVRMVGTIAIVFGGIALLTRRYLKQPRVLAMFVVLLAVHGAIFSHFMHFWSSSPYFLRLILTLCDFMFVGVLLSTTIASPKRKETGARHPGGQDTNPGSRAS